MFVVEMYRDVPLTDSFAAYSCGSSTWKGLLALARTFGWKPLGTIADPKAARDCPDYVRLFKTDYDPNDWAYCKRIGDADAKNLAIALRQAMVAMEDGKVVALERSGPQLLHDEMAEEEFKRVNGLPSKSIAEFVNFLDGGGFVFAWDD